MFYVTGAEPGLDDVIRRIDAYPDVLHEVRVDCLVEGREDLRRLDAYGSRVLVTVRTTAHGGRFAGDHRGYEQLVGSLFEETAGRIDVEWSAEPHVARLVKRAPPRVLLSWHGRAADDHELDGIVESMNVLRAGMCKVALQIDDAAELERLLRVSERLHRPFLLLGLGDAGRASRVLHRAFRSEGTFVSAGEPVPGAPGQMSIHEARPLIPDSTQPVPLGIVGGEQVTRSPGLAVYNRIFRARGLPYAYVAWPTGRLEASLRLMARLGFRGVSVTMPHKQTALALCTRVDELAARVGAVNSLVREGDGWVGYNTDAGAVRDSVRAAGATRGQRAAVLGTGGAARAAVVALAMDGLHVDVFGRTPDAAQGLAHEGPGVSVHSWGELAADRYDVIVQATPVGSNGVNCPVAASSKLGGRVVMDMIHTPEVTPLVKMAREQGARVITGRDMWILQGVEQMRHMLGIELGPDELAHAWIASPTS